MGTTTLSPFFGQQDTKHTQSADQAILVFAEMLKPTSRIQVHPVHVLSGGRPELIYGVMDGLSAALRSFGGSPRQKFSERLKTMFVDFVADIGHSRGINAFVQKDAETLLFAIELWRPVAQGIFGFDLQGTCRLRETSRYSSWHPVRNEFRHIIKTPALSEIYLSTRVAAFTWALPRLVDPMQMTKQETRRVKEIGALVSEIRAQKATVLPHSFDLWVIESESRNVEAFAGW